MARTSTNADLQVTKYNSEYFKEFIREHRFSRYINRGVNDNNSVIFIKQDRQRVEIPLVTQLKGNGVSGSQTLRGNGEHIGNYGLTLEPNYYRHLVEFDKQELEKPSIDLMMAARPLLMEWSKQIQRDHIMEALGGIYDGATYANYGSATDAQLDSWNTNNSDRILYGNAKSNYVSGDHTGSLGNITTANGKLDTDIVSLVKRMAQQADPHIRPLKSTEDEEMFVMFADPYAFRDIKSDSAMQQAQREGLQRGSKFQPLFTGGDLIWDNVIIREIPELAYFVDGGGTNRISNAWGSNASSSDGLNNAGGSNSRIGLCVLCGQQAVAYGLGQAPMIHVDRHYDFDFKPGVAVELKHEIKKTFFKQLNVQHGMVTAFVSAAADS